MTTTELRRDVAAVVGLLLILSALWLIWKPLALLLAGIVVLYFALPSTKDAQR